MSESDTIEVQPRPCWIAGRAEQGERTLTVHHPYDGTEIADVAVPGAGQVERAVAAAAGVAREFAAGPARVRAVACDVIAEEIVARSEEITETITAENGKPLRWAEAEVDAAVAAFRFAAGEAGQLATGRTSTDDGRLTVVRRRSRGPVLAVSPATFPLSMLARQVAAAVAVGAPVVVRPAPATPMTALLLGEILADQGLPDGVFSVLPDAGLHGLVADPRLPVIAFAGPSSAGWETAEAAPHKHVVLASDDDCVAVVCADWSSDADLDIAARRIATFDMPRRVIVAAAVADRFVPALVATVRSLRTGSPHDPDVQVGPMINDEAAEQAVKWITAAVEAGGELLAGGTRTGTCVAPTVIRNGPAQDLAGPVLVVSVVDDDEAAFVQAKGSRSAVFTRDALAAATRIDGDVVIGDVSPHAGREGVRAMVQEYTKDQVLVLR